MESEVDRLNDMMPNTERNTPSVIDIHSKLDEIIHSINSRFDGVEARLKRIEKIKAKSEKEWLTEVVSQCVFYQVQMYFFLYNFLFFRCSKIQI